MNNIIDHGPVPKRAWLEIKPAFESVWRHQVDKAEAMNGVVKIKRTKRGVTITIKDSNR